MKKFEITKEQIESLYNCDYLSEIKQDLKSMFPQAFESELEVGKWYKSDYPLLIFITEVKHHELVGYGFNAVGFYSEGTFCTRADERNRVDYNTFNFKPATDKEVETALINEAKRRGFKEGVEIKPINKVIHLNNKIDLEYNTCFYESENEFWMGGYCLFKDGKWAEIISEPIEVTLEQIAEKFNVNVEQLKIKK